MRLAHLPPGRGLKFVQLDHFGLFTNNETGVNNNRNNTSKGLAYRLNYDDHKYDPNPASSSIRSGMLMSARDAIAKACALMFSACSSGKRMTHSACALCAQLHSNLFAPIMMRKFLNGASN